MESYTDYNIVEDFPIFFIDDSRFMTAEPRYIPERTATYINKKKYRCPLPHQFHIY